MSTTNTFPPRRELETADLRKILDLMGFEYCDDHVPALSDRQLRLGLIMTIDTLLGAEELRCAPFVGADKDLAETIRNNVQVMIGLQQCDDPHHTYRGCCGPVADRD